MSTSSRSAARAVAFVRPAPCFTLHDIDENKPRGSIKIRVETVVYALERYVERLRASRYGNRPVEHGRAACAFAAWQRALSVRR